MSPTETPLNRKSNKMSQDFTHSLAYKWLLGKYSVKSSTEEDKNVSKAVPLTAACLLWRTGTEKQCGSTLFYKTQSVEMNQSPATNWPRLVCLHACVYRRAANRKHPAVNRECVYVSVSESGKKEPTRRECFPFQNILSWHTHLVVQTGRENSWKKTKHFLINSNESNPREAEVQCLYQNMSFDCQSKLFWDEETWQGSKVT